MFEVLLESWSILTGYSGIELVILFWPLFFLELPRYTITIIIASIYYRKPSVTPLLPLLPYSLVMVGHNEAKNLERSIKSLKEQSHPPTEILVMSDGSSDDMRKKLTELQQKGLIQGAHHVNFRGGKAAAINLIKEYTKYDIIVAVDCDSSFHRHAMKIITSRFKNPKTGAVCGLIVARHPYTNLLTVLQYIEYIFSIALGKLTSDIMGQLSCLSGAFTAFRRSALEEVGGADAGSGEDLDISLRLRKAGWEIRYAKDAVCYTQVPEKIDVLIRQRLRWERDAFALRFFKHADTINPFKKSFSSKEVFHNIDFLVFNVLSAMITIGYVPWIIINFGEAAPAILVATWLILMINDFVLLSSAILLCPNIPLVWSILYLPIFSLYTGVFMRLVRLTAYFQEIIFRTSKKDDFVPSQVRNEIMHML